MKYWVELGIKNMEKREKIHIHDIFGSCVPVHLECVPVHFRGVPVHLLLYFLVSTSFRILAITVSFLIQFELFKWPIKIDFKENQTY